MPRLKLEIILPSVNGNNQEEHKNSSNADNTFNYQQVKATPSLPKLPQMLSVMEHLTADPISQLSSAARQSSINLYSDSRRSSRGRLAEDYKNLMFKHTDLEQVIFILVC